MDPPAGARPNAKRLPGGSPLQPACDRRMAHSSTVIFAVRSGWSWRKYS
jgi:hypothetical protein